MNRRGFIKGLGAAAFGPWVVTHAGVLMSIKVQSLPMQPSGSYWYQVTNPENHAEKWYFSDDGIVWTVWPGGEPGASVTRAFSQFVRPKPLVDGKVALIMKIGEFQ